MKYQLLGRLRVVDEGGAWTIGSQKVEILLTALLIRSDHVVSADQLMAEIWSERLPVRATAGLHVYVSEARKFLARCGRSSSPVITQAPGYMLRKDPDELDFQWFLELVDLGRCYAEDHCYSEASECFDTALALWRGPALGGIGDGPILRSFATWMSETRMECEEMLVEAQLQLGRHREVVGRLYALVAENPFQEGFYRQLMLALYRSDRRVDALRAYQHARRVLVAELGLEPCSTLRNLYQAILRGDDALVGAGLAS